MHGDFVAPRLAVVLAAGLGTRLGARTVSTPKCLIEVNGIPILVNALACLESAGVEETVIVVGYRQDVVRRRLGDWRGSMRLSFRSNTVYRSTSTSVSLWTALCDVDEDVLVAEGDVFFEPSVLDGLLQSPYRDATLVERWNPQLDGSVVEIAEDRTVRAWIHKNARPPGLLMERTHKTVNLHRFGRCLVREQLRPMLAAQVVGEGRGEPLETTLATIVQNGALIHAAKVSGRWVEIDDESDLRSAEAMFTGACHGH